MFKIIMSVCCDLRLFIKLLIALLTCVYFVSAEEKNNPEYVPLGAHLDDEKKMNEIFDAILKAVAENPDVEDPSRADPQRIELGLYSANDTPTKVILKSELSGDLVKTLEKEMILQEAEEEELRKQGVTHVFPISTGKYTIFVVLYNDKTKRHIQLTYELDDKMVLIDEEDQNVIKNVRPWLVALIKSGDLENKKPK